MKIGNRLFLSIFILIYLLSACAPQNETVQATQILVEPSATPEKLTYSVWLAPYLPEQIREQIALPAGVTQTDAQEEADIWMDVGGDLAVSQWIYALAAPFSTVTDAITMQQLKKVWQGEVEEDFPLQILLVDGNTKAIFEKVWGVPSSAIVHLTDSNSLLATAWSESGAWAILPFDDLETRWKVIAIDDISPLDDDFAPASYALTVTFSLLGRTGDLQAFSDLIAASGTAIAPVTNRDADKITTIDMTGVTALVRGTAYLMEKYGMTYPALDIGDILRAADITHISNEIPFTESCPNPFYNTANDANLVFCSKPDYINLLDSVGTDVMELTGDHFRDWGADAMLYTLELYDQRGWQYYGGGRNLAEGQQPAYFEHNGNKIAFIGCNAKPQGYATADVDYPGAVHCDMEVMTEQIKEARASGYIPVVTFQHVEYYDYAASPYLVTDFHQVAEAGAAIVSGSQAHQPHAFEFYRGAFLHYGLGNLFFDQYGEGYAQRQAFIDRYVIYDGRVINTDLITIMFVDMARPRLMLPEERQDLLETIFYASGW